MTNKCELVLFGVRSPLLPDYEETCSRLGLQIAAVRVDELRPRLLDRSVMIEIGDLDESRKSLPFLACAFSPRRRMELSTMALDVGLTAVDALTDPTAVIASSTRIGSGSYIGAGVIIGAVGMLGEHVFINRSSNLGHHAFVDDFVSIGPGCTLAGNVHLGKRAFVGAGSVVLPGVRIGAGAVVAAGSVVKNDVPDGVMVAGVPATIKKERLGPNVYGQAGEE